MGNKTWLPVGEQAVAKVLHVVEFLAATAAMLLMVKWVLQAAVTTMTITMIFMLTITTIFRHGARD